MEFMRILNPLYLIKVDLQPSAANRYRHGQSTVDARYRAVSLNVQKTAVGRRLSVAI